MTGALLESKTTDDVDESGGISMLTLLTAAKPLPWDEQARLIAAAQAGDDQARNMLIEKSLRLVASIVNKYKAFSHSLEEPDLFQEGVFGLADAIDTFSFEFGCRFSTHAITHIKKRILEALRNLDAPIRIPSNANGLSRKVLRTAQRLGQSTSSQASLETIAAAIDITPEKITELLSLPCVASSLDEKLDEDNNNCLLDIRADPDSISPENEALLRHTKEVLLQGIYRLPVDMQQVIARRYGLEGHYASSCSEVALELEMPPQRVSHLETQALKRLRRMLNEELLCSINS